MESTLQDIRELIAEGKYQQTSLETVKMLEGLASSPEIMDVFDGNIGILHGDLNAGNVFRLPSGYKIIDWQGPVFGPKDLDALKLSRDLHLDPIKHFSKGIVGIDMFLCIHWVTQCRKRWIPWGPWFDGIAAEKAKQMGDLLF